MRKRYIITLRLSTRGADVSRRARGAMRPIFASIAVDPVVDRVATFCASCAQSRSLRLPPWQPAPCNIGNIEAALADTDEVSGYRAAALLCQRMQRCGVSRWHPDPVAACEAAEAKRHDLAER